MPGKHDALVPEWVRLYTQEGLTQLQIAERYGLTRNQVKNAMSRYQGAPTDEEVPSVIEDDFLPDEEINPNWEQKGEIIFEDKVKPPSDHDVRELLEAYIGVMEKSKRFKTSQRFANVTIKGDKPIGMVFFGDEHVGSWSWAWKRMIEDFTLVAETDGVYSNFMGDSFDNFLFNFAKWASVMPPAHQKRISEYLASRIRPKTVAVVGGNHNHWTKKVADVDANAELAENVDAVFMGHRGDLMLSLGEQRYHFHLHHRARNASSINKANSGRVASDDIGGADVIVEADRHDPWVHNEYKARKRQVWMRTGTYKMDDDYTDEIGFPQGKWDMPMVVIFPKEHTVVPFMDFRHGISYLKAVRA